jgi:threonine/homoserine efflux transporter RhtA
LAKLNFIFYWGDSLIPVNIGFFITTGGYLLFSFIYLKALRWHTAVGLSFAVTLLVFYSFNKGFGIPIP